MTHNESTNVAFVAFDKAAGLTCKPQKYYCDGRGRDYMITHDLYESGKISLHRPNFYDYSSNVFMAKGLEKNWHPNADNYRTGRTKFKRYFGNGTGNDGFVIKNNGGHYRDGASMASMVKDFKNDFRRPADNSIKIENMNRKKEMMKNIHAIEKDKVMAKIRLRKQTDSASRLSCPKFLNEKFPTQNTLRAQKSELN